MAYDTIETELRHGVALIWLNRPSLRNALNATLIDETTDAVRCAIDDEAVRAIVLSGRGSAFCAGADLAWMASGRTMSPAESPEDSMRLARLLRLLHDSPKPTVARVQGPAFAGGMGLVAACDVSVASTEARFCLSEVKLGLIPAMISPYVIRAMGQQQARRWFVTGEVFDAAEAWRIGFVHELVPPDRLDEAVNGIVGHLLAGGPQALGACKQLVQDIAGRPIDDTIGLDTAARIARVRATDEAQEGIAAFFDKRRPAWAQQPPTP